MAKLKLTVVALVAIIITLLSQGTIAYYSTVGKAANVITSGGVNLQIIETTAQGTPFPEEGVYVMPGDVVSKQVTIKNVSEHPFYLRVKIVYGVNSTALTAEECFKLNVNNTDWTYSDGWYYYTAALAPDEITPAIFSNVEIVGKKVDNSYLNKTLMLTVDAQAVQSENNPAPDGDITLVTGWPAEVEGGSGE